MAVLQMQRVSICALKKDRKAILEKLQALGVMEMNQIADEEGFEKMDTVNAKLSFEKKAQLTETALGILDIYAPQKQSMLSGLAGKELVSQDEFQKITAKKDEVIEKADALLTKSKEIAEIKANIVKIENRIESLEPWLSLDAPMNYAGTARTAMLLGTMPAGTDEAAIHEKVATECPEIEALDVQIISEDADAVYLAVFCLKKEAEKTEEALRAGGFARPSQISNQIPAKEKENLKAEIQKLNKEIEVTEEEIKGYATSREELKVVGDYFRLRAEKYEVLGTLPQSQRTFVISGYVAEKTVPVLKKAIADRYDCVMDVEELKEEEEPPVILKNNAFSDSVEGVLESYGLPHKGEFDPTTIMSFFYVFFFGMMLSDAAYGAIIAIACFVVLKVHEDVYVLWFIYTCVGCIIWRLLRRRCRCCRKDIL